MEPQSESNQEPRHEPVKGKAAMRSSAQVTNDDGIEAPRLRRFDDDSTSHVDTHEPTPIELQDGALDTIEFYEDATGKGISAEDLDEETTRLLYESALVRAGWSETMERNARMALQSAYPDVGGSKVHGPL